MLTQFVWTWKKVEKINWTWDLDFLHQWTFLVMVYTVNKIIKLLIGRKIQKSTNFLGKWGFVHFCGNWVQRRVLLLYTAIAEHDNTVSLTLRFWKSNHYLRSYRKNKINKYSETLLCTILYYTAELFRVFFLGFLLTNPKVLNFFRFFFFSLHFTVIVNRKQFLLGR